MELRNYGKDGADKQARAVLPFIQEEIEESYDYNIHEYVADIQIGRWENYREQGYVVNLRNLNNEQLNIAFFEHRDSDDIVAFMWEENTINSPTIDSPKFQEIFPSKWDYTFSVKYGQCLEMADWINERLHNHWMKAVVHKE